MHTYTHTHTHIYIRCFIVAAHPQSSSLTSRWSTNRVPSIHTSWPSAIFVCITRIWCRYHKTFFDLFLYLLSSQRLSQERRSYFGAWVSRRLPSVCKYYPEITIKTPSKRVNRSACRLSEWSVTKTPVGCYTLTLWRFQENGFRVFSPEVV